mmetsp:Transcript_29409/g.47191  ORF Transcript_29409/g.47191 Transcript_29409/m.47191 type:complete len:92 (-) Transcript_29409:769-1044(-)
MWPIHRETKLLVGGTLNDSTMPYILYRNSRDMFLFLNAALAALMKQPREIVWSSDSSWSFINHRMAAFSLLWFSLSLWLTASSTSTTTSSS